jgi:hypothetical protein
MQPDKWIVFSKLWQVPSLRSAAGFRLAIGAVIGRSAYF